jgi:HSP20 family protein
MSVLAKRSNPTSMLRLLDAFRRDLDGVDRLFEEFSHFHGLPFVAGTGLAAPAFSPQLDIKEGKDDFCISMELPGLTEKDIEVSVDNDVLSVSGEKKAERKEEGDDYIVAERSYGTFRREIPLGKDVDQNGINAKFQNGVLSLSLPKTKEAKKKTKRINVSST